MNKTIITTGLRRSGITYRCAALGIGLTAQPYNVNLLLFTAADSVYNYFRNALGEYTAVQEEAETKPDLQYVLNRSAFSIHFKNRPGKTDTYLYSSDMLEEPNTPKKRDFYHLVNKALDMLQDDRYHVNIIATESVSQDVLNMVNHLVGQVKDPFNSRLHLYV